MLTDCCSTMITTAKENGNSEKTIDYEHLNSQLKQETDHIGPPFQLALHIISKQKKTVLDAVDGSHSFP